MTRIQQDSDPRESSSVSFVISARDETDTVGTVVAHALDVTGPRQVIVVDSGSVDDTASTARAAGAEVLRGTPGKGAAMQLGIDASRGDWICFLDADLTYSERRIPSLLAAAARDLHCDHVVGDFDDGLNAVLTNTHGFYQPLIRGLFPEVAGKFGSKPLTGFRAIRASFLKRPLPIDFGVEAYLNITTILAGAVTSVVSLGRFTGKLKANKVRSYEISSAILDLAVEHGRLDVGHRPEWESWVDSVYEVASSWEPSCDQQSYRARLLAVANSPQPVTGV